MLFWVWSLIISAVILAFFIVIFRFLDQQTRLEYQALYNDEYYKDDNPNGKCPQGCLGGTCQSDFCTEHSPPNAKCCAFDFQCKFCETPAGEPFGKVYEKIKKEYDTYQNREDVKRLNDRIFKENIYIAKINDFIKKGKL